LSSFEEVWQLMKKHVEKSTLSKTLCQWLEGSIVTCVEWGAITLYPEAVRWSTPKMSTGHFSERRYITKYNFHITLFFRLVSHFLLFIFC
jgi:hypothetical protein